MSCRLLTPSHTAQIKALDDSKPEVESPGFNNNANWSVCYGGIEQPMSPNAMHAEVPMLMDAPACLRQ